MDVVGGSVLQADDGAVFPNAEEDVFTIEALMVFRTEGLGWRRRDRFDAVNGFEGMVRPLVAPTTRRGCYALRAGPSPVATGRS